MLAAVVAGWMGGAAAQERFRPRAVTAQSFVVVDEAGRKRAEFGFSAKDRLVLRLYDEQGQVIWSAPHETRILPLETPR